MFGHEFFAQNTRCPGVARHDHARHPEENDVPAGDEHAGRVVVLQFFRIVEPVENTDGPEPGAEPGIDHVGVAAQLGGGQLGIAGLRAGHLQRLGLGFGHKDFFAVEPGRDLLTPPQLPTDAPVAHVLFA